MMIRYHIGGRKTRNDMILHGCNSPCFKLTIHIIVSCYGERNQQMLG